MEYQFTKLHGLGNDFVFINDWDSTINFTKEQVSFICDRHFGIGADGIILVRKSPREECAGYMHYINSDGTLAEMCGNGIRCFSKFLVDNGYVDYSSGSFIADTLRGPLAISFKTDENHHLTQATVDMDEPILNPELVPVNLEPNAQTEDGISYVKEYPLESPWGIFFFTCVSMGNPHAVCFLDDLDALDPSAFLSEERSLETFNLNQIGAYFEAHPFFPAKSNIEFVVKKGTGLEFRVYERGCGETLACGTGTCATLVAASLTGRSSRQNTISLRGGDLYISWEENNHVFMTGPATESFTGVITL